MCNTTTCRKLARGFHPSDLHQVLAKRIVRVQQQLQAGSTSKTFRKEEIQDYQKRGENKVRLRLSGSQGLQDYHQTSKFQISHRVKAPDLKLSVSVHAPSLVETLLADLATAGKPVLSILIKAPDAQAMQRLRPAASRGSSTTQIFRLRRKLQKSIC